MNDKCQTAKIRDLNDRFRTTGRGGRIMITRGVKALGRVAIEEIMEMIRIFDMFTENNDPYLEHDFGKIIYNGETLFWMIDYYDKTFEFAAPKPADPTVTERLLTVLLADEY